MEIETKMCRLNDIFNFSFWKIRMEIKTKKQKQMSLKWYIMSFKRRIFV